MVVTRGLFDFRLLGVLWVIWLTEVVVTIGWGVMDHLIRLWVLLCGGVGWLWQWWV